MSGSIKRVLLSGACALALVANGAGGALAQQQQRERQQPQQDKTEREGAVHDRIMLRSGPEGPAGETVFAGQSDGFSFTFLSSEMAFDSKIVKGAPYSAEAVSESVQVLSDGNRITRKTTALVYRDGEGRTRRDQTATPLGPFATAEEQPQTVFINDPVAGVNYVLNSRTRTAHKAMQYSFVMRQDAELRATHTAAAAAGVVTPLRTSPTLVVAVQSDGKQGGASLGHRATNRVQPVYPAVAKAAKAEGMVRVEIVINEAGEVESARAVDGHPLLRGASVDAAKQWRFEPAVADGKPAKAKGFISFSFVLPGEQMTDAARRQAETAAAGGDAGMVIRSGSGGGSGVGVRQARTLTFERTPDGAEMKAVGVPVEMKGVKESLGKQMFDGVEAEGTRNTVTIPAGSIGNERPIQIVSERWFSAELQTVVMSRHSDPRFGETNYRLTNISRAEPDRSLFEVPAGYTVSDSGPFERRMLPARKPKTEQ